MKRREKSTVPFTLISGLWALERKKKEKGKKNIDRKRTFSPGGKKRSVEKIFKSCWCQ